MEEIQKKTKKADTVKTKAKKTATKTTNGETKTSKTKTTKKTTAVPKTKTVKKQVKTSEKLEPKKEEKQPKDSAPKKQEKQPKDSALKNQPKTSNNSEQKEEKKEKKNYIDISVGAIICVAIIIGLLILNVKLGTRAYNVITKNETANSNIETDNNISVTQEVGNVLSNNDELVTQMKEKITFAPNATASIYETENFSTNTISNDLKLRLGWAKTAEVTKLRAKNENNEEIESVEKETMAENIKNVFGPNIKYKDESFKNTNISPFSAYCKNQGTISYSDGIYTSVVSEDIETEIAPVIYQEIQKVVKYSDKVIVYVKVAYMDTEEDKYIVYKDFIDGEFEERLLEITPEELFQEEAFNQYTGKGTVTINANTSLDSIRNQLDTYKFTFSLDEETEEYYLTKFNKALSMQ